jgi:hypothetical protein
MTALTYGSTNSGGGLAAIFWVIYIAVIVLVIAGFWVTFTKAGEAGWKAIIPFYNTIILLKIIGRPWWWLLLLFIPFVNIVILIFMWNGLSKSFGKTAAFTVGLFFLPYIFVPILGFGPARYLGPSAPGAIPPTPAPPPMPA